MENRYLISGTQIDILKELIESESNNEELNEELNEKVDDLLNNFLNNQHIGYSDSAE